MWNLTRIHQIILKNPTYQTNLYKFLLKVRPHSKTVFSNILPLIIINKRRLWWKIMHYRLDQTDPMGASI